MKALRSFHSCLEIFFLQPLLQYSSIGSMEPVFRTTYVIDCRGLIDACAAWHHHPQL